MQASAVQLVVVSAVNIPQVHCHQLWHLMPGSVRLLLQCSSSVSR